MPIFFVFVNTFSYLWVPVLKFSLPFQLQNLGLGSTSSSPPQKFHQESKNRHYLVDYRDTSQTLHASCDTDSIVLHTVYLPCNKPTGFIPTLGQPFVTNSYLTRFPQKKEKHNKTLRAFYKNLHKVTVGLFIAQFFLRVSRKTQLALELVLTSQKREWPSSILWKMSIQWLAEAQNKIFKKIQTNKIKTKLEKKWRVKEKHHYVSE